MSCFKNKIAKENFKKLTEVFGSKDTALTLISANNGYSLEFDKDGNPSVLFKQILDIVGNKEQAFILKSTIYKRAFLDEPFLSDISESFAEDDAPRKKITMGVMKSIVYEEAISIGTTVKPKGGHNDNVKKAGTNTLYSDNPARTAGIINSRYEQDIASVQNGHVLINPSDSYIDHMIKVENQKRADAENLRMINEFIQNEEEANYHILKPFDDYGNPLFETQEEMEDSALPRELTRSDKQGDFMKYKEYVANDISKLQQRLNALIGKNKTTYDRAESHALTEKIARIQLRIKELKERKKELTSTAAVLENIEGMAATDLTRVQNLLSSKSTSRDLIEARDIITWYMSLGEFVVKANHPFFKDSLEYDNEKMKKAFMKIYDNFKEMQGKLDDMNMKHIEAAFIAHRNIKEVKDEKGKIEAYTFGDTKIEKGNVMDYLFGDVHDIDKLSALFLDPTLTYDFKRGEGFSESVIPQIMSSLFVDRISEKMAYGQEKMAIIDTLFHKLRGIIKGDYSIFYQKDSREFQTEFLINPFKSEWFSLKTSIELDEEKRFERIRKDGEFIDIRRLPEVKEAFKNAGFGFRFTSDVDAKRYSERLKAKIGAGTGKENYEYKRIVDSQIKLIDQFTFERAAFVKERFPEKTVDDLSPKEREILEQYDLENSPFHVFNVPETNQHSHIVDGEVVQITPNAKFNEFIPNNENIEKYKDPRFETISDNSEMYRLWNEVSEVLLYVNNVLASVGQDRVTFNSLLAMEKQFRKQIGRTDLPLGSMVKNAHSKIVGKIIKGLGVKEYEFTGKENDEESINYGNMKSTKVLVDRKNGNYQSMLKTFEMTITDGIKIKTLTSKKDIPNNAKVTITDELVDFLKKVMIEEDFNEFIKLKNNSYDFLKKAIRTGARREIIDQHRMDLPKVLRHFISHAIRVDAANEVAPTILLMQNYYNQLTTPNIKDKRGKVVKEGGEQRIRGEKRVDQWIETAVKGNFAEKGAPIGKKMLTPEEKKERKFLKELAQRLKDEREAKHRGETLSIPSTYEESIQERMENLGRKFDMMLPFKVAHPIIMFMGMAFNFVSGSRNVAYGIISNVFHDAVGDLWTRGNSLRVVNFVMGKGRKQFYLRQPLRGKADIMHHKRHGKNLVLAEMFIDRSKIIQDMRNEKQRASNRLGKTTGKQKFNPYYLSITAPEWRNQTITILSTLMDEEIIDSHGNKSKIFNGNEFLIYNEVDEEGRIKGTSYTKIVDGKKVKKKSKGGILQLKPEFRYQADGITENTENINNWEKMSGGDYRAFRENAVSNVKIVHGDYSNVAGIPIKNTQFGTYWMIFLGWLPAMIWSYWGHGPNLAAGKIRHRSVMRSAKPITATLFTASLTMGAFGLTTFGWPLAIGAGAALVAGIVAEATRKEKSQVPILRELWVTLAELSLTTLNIPIALATRRTIKGMDVEKKLGLTREEAGAMRGLLVNIGMRINLILMSNLLYKFADCEEDTWKCKKQIMARNFVINNAGMLLDDLGVIANPMSLLQTMSTDGTFLRFVLKLGDWIGAAEKLDRFEDIITTGEFQGGSKTQGKLGKTFMPSIFKYIGVNVNADWGDMGQGEMPLPLTTPVSMDRIFDKRFLFIERSTDYNKYDRYETIREVKRDEEEARLNKLNKKRPANAKWSDNEIDAKAGKAFPTLTSRKNRLNTEYGKGTSLAESRYEQEVDEFLEEHDN